MNGERKAPHLNVRELSDAERWAERLAITRVREMTPCERLEQMELLNRAERDINLWWLRLRYPCADDAELKLREAALRLGRDSMIRFFGWDPDVEGW